MSLEGMTVIRNQVDLDHHLNKQTNRRWCFSFFFRNDNHQPNWLFQHKEKKMNGKSYENHAGTSNAKTLSDIEEKNWKKSRQTTGTWTNPVPPINSSCSPSIARRKSKKQLKSGRKKWERKRRKYSEEMEKERTKRKINKHHHFS